MLGVWLEQLAALNISPRTVRRDWQFAKAWLSQLLETPELSVQRTKASIRL